MRRLVFAIAVLAGGLAHASSEYPPEIRAHLGLSYTPDCSLCHANGQTGFGTVTTPFGTSMRSRGLVARNIASLDTALDALSAERTDSDHDGVPDVDELKAGSDPNVGGGGSVTPPTYGCFDVTGQPGSPLALLALAVGLLLLRARRASPEMERGRAPLFPSARTWRSRVARLDGALLVARPFFLARRSATARRG